MVRIRRNTSRQDIFDALQVAMDASLDRGEDELAAIIRALPTVDTAQLWQFIVRAQRTNRIPAAEQERVRETLHVMYRYSDEVSVDGDALILDNEDDGYWVEAWHFVRYDDEDDEE